MIDLENLDNAVVISVPSLIKALPASENNGARIIEVEASCEEVDLEGDVVLQQALLNSAKHFVSKGMIDLEHYGEIGERLGIADPTSYIIGRPLAVTDLGGKRTGVRAEIMRSQDGSIDPGNNRYDSFWKSLQSNPPVTWYSSIFAFPTDWDNCGEKSCTHGATRYVIKEMEWHSLAMTRHPMNNKIKGAAKIVKANQYIELAKAWAPEPPKEVFSMKSLRKTYENHIVKDCPFGGPGIISRGCFQQHFEECGGMTADSADILSHALFSSLLVDMRS